MQTSILIPLSIFIVMVCGYAAVWYAVSRYQSTPVQTTYEGEPAWRFFFRYSRGGIQYNWQLYVTTKGIWMGRLAKRLIPNASIKTVKVYPASLDTRFEMHIAESGSSAPEEYSIFLRPSTAKAFSDALRKNGIDVREKE